MRKLTVGMAVYDDYDGLYFTIQSLRLYHKEILNDIEFVIIDNNPASNHGKAIRDLTNWIVEPFQYLPFTKYSSTTTRNKIFSLSDTPYTLSIDSHVMIVPGALKKLIDYYDEGLDKGNLLQGPILYDDCKTISTHFDDKWGSYMWGQWQTDPKGLDENSPPFEIPAQGLGLYTCRTDSWLGYNKHFRGFGGEENYIHEKYRQHGKKTICLPFLRWMHRFNRPNGIPYTNDLKQRFKNYIIGHIELSLDMTNLKEHYKSILSKEEMNLIEREVREQIFGQILPS